MAGATPTATADNSTAGSSELKNTTGPFATITLLFFFWGFITVMNDVLIPFLKDEFGLTYFQANLVQSAFFGAYFVVSLAYFLISIGSGDPINRVGYQRASVIGLLVCVAGCGCLYLAAMAGVYVYCLGALFLLASGVTLLQIAANPYAAILGKPENASSRLNLAQAINSFGTTLGPIAGGLLLYKILPRFLSDDTTDLSEVAVSLDALGWVYLIFAGLGLLLAGAVALSHLPKIDQEASDSAEGGAFSFPQLRLGMIAIFLYVGAEVAIGSFLVDFVADKSVMGWTKSVATIFLAYYWGGAMIGRLCGAIAMTDNKNSSGKPLKILLTSIGLLGIIYVLTAMRMEHGIIMFKFLPFNELLPFIGLIGLCLVALAAGRGKPSLILTVFSIVLIVLLIVGALATGRTAMWAILGAGLFNSIMWSNIFTLAIDDLKEHTSQGSSLLVMMIVGGAFFPLLMGYAADKIGIQHSFFIPIISYVYIAFYGWWNHKRMANKQAAA